MPLLALARYNVYVICGEGGHEVVECRFKLDACESDWEGDELHISLVFLEDRNEGGIFLGLLRKFDVASEVSEEAELDDDEGALFSCGMRTG